MLTMENFRDFPSVIYVHVMFLVNTVSVGKPSFSFSVNHCYT